MNNKISLNKLTLEQLYVKYKDYLIPILSIIICFFLLVFITIPQIGILSEKQQQYNLEKTKLQILTNNYNVLSGLNDITLNSQLALAVGVLPSGKNFSSVLNSINLAANKSGVFLGDYEFQVGDLSKIPLGKNVPALELTLSINGGVNETVKFVNELYNSLPIAEVTNITVSNNRSSIIAIFYYKPFADNKNNSSPVTALSKNYLDTINQVSSWNNPQVLEIISSLNASQSASPNSAPF